MNRLLSAGLVPTGSIGAKITSQRGEIFADRGARILVDVAEHLPRELAQFRRVGQLRETVARFRARSTASYR